MKTLLVLILVSLLVLVSSEREDADDMREKDEIEAPGGRKQIFKHKQDVKDDDREDDKGTLLTFY